MMEQTMDDEKMDPDVVKWAGKPVNVTAEAAELYLNAKGWVHLPTTNTYVNEFMGVRPGQGLPRGAAVLRQYRSDMATLLFAFGHTPVKLLAALLTGAVIEVTRQMAEEIRSALRQAESDAKPKGPVN